MTQLHFSHVAGRALSIIDAILHTPEVTAVGGALGPVHLVIEELVVNIVNYAYPADDDTQAPTADYLDVEISIHEEKLRLRFRDGGVPFNPLELPPPDMSLPMSQRKKGGLGIFLVKREADELAYEYTSGENVLTVSLDVGDKMVDGL